jgi:hypothetical protein
LQSVTTSKFRKAFDNLPEDIKKLARKSYSIWKIEPYHPSLQFKRIHSKEEIYSVRIGLSYRALAVKEEGIVIWFWIGSHEDYNKL